LKLLYDFPEIQQNTKLKLEIPYLYSFEMKISQHAIFYVLYELSTIPKKIFYKNPFG